MAARHLLLTLAVLCGQAHAHSDAAQAAALNARHYEQEIRNSFSRCASTFGDKGAELFPMVQVFWLSNHGPIAEAVARVRRDVTDPKPSRSGSPAPLPFMRAFDAGNAVTKHRLCNDLLEKHLNGTLKYEHAEPQHAEILKDAFGTAREWRIAQRNADFTTGCMKRHWNAGRRQIEEIQAACDCQTSVMLRVASDDELDAFVANLGQPDKEKPSLDNTPWLRTAAPLMAACAKVR
jgi:hypothetical protein